MGSLPDDEGFKLQGREGMSGGGSDWMCLDVQELRIVNGRQRLTEQRGTI
jgi:hypothetical protein